MKNIVLTGLMGCGKTSVAKSLKNIFTNFELTETDSLIEAQEGMTINEIFSQKGEKYFREAESNLINNILKEENKIISLGGGSLEYNFDWKLAREKSVIFYLKADTNVLFERIKNDTQRPLLKCENPKEKLRNLLDIRKNNYEKADYIIDVNELSIEQITRQIEEIYNND